VPNFEYIIPLNDKRSKELVKRSELVGIDNELQFLQDHIENWLDDSNRLTHKEK